MSHLAAAVRAADRLRLRLIQTAAKSGCLDTLGTENAVMKVGIRLEDYYEYAPVITTGIPLFALTLLHSIDKWDMRLLGGRIRIKAP